MILKHVKIHQVRNIASYQLELNPRFNMILGANGSGKTSVLEALYILSCGRSFRSREVAPIITHGQDSLTVFAQTQTDETISIQKSRSELTQIKMNSQFCQTTSQLAYALPSQVFYTDIFQIIDSGAAVRRSVLDWGLFHVKHEYLPLWKEYKKVLKQRNALLKTGAPYSQFEPWDQQLGQLAESLDGLRADYFKLWEQAFYRVLAELTDTECTLSYFRGWDRKNSGKSLQAILIEHFQSDKLKTFTQIGAHQADLIIESKDTRAKHVLSRGQQKIILFALKLAQARLLEKPCLYLIDDFAAELDVQHQRRLLDYLQQEPGQYVITSTQLTPVMESVTMSVIELALPGLSTA